MRRLCPDARATERIRIIRGVHQAIGDGRSDRCSSIACPSTPGQGRSARAPSARCCWSRLAACSPLKPRPDLPPESALPPAAATALDDAIATARDRASGRFADSAWSPTTWRPSRCAWSRPGWPAAASTCRPTSGMPTSPARALGACAAAAADRGVRVRLLVDDMDARAKNAGFAAIAAHPNVQVRLFNPFASRSGFLSYAAEALGSFNRINHRMHNKSWIADNRLAIVGGRNLGDEYFGASDEVEFRRPGLRDGRPGGAGRVGLVRPLLELAAGLPGDGARPRCREGGTPGRLARRAPGPLGRGRPGPLRRRGEVQRRDRAHARQATCRCSGRAAMPSRPTTR